MKWYDKQKKQLLDKISVVDDKINKAEAEESDKLIEELENLISNPQETPSLEDILSDTPEEIPVVLQSIDLHVEKTIIGKGTHITGDVETAGDLFISGSLLGNIICQGTLELNGEIQGDIVCGSGKFTNTSIHGSIDCKDDLIMESNTNINGNIKANSLILNGSIIGNIKANNSVQLMMHSRVEGNVEAQYMECERGSSINGQCTISPLDEIHRY